MREKQKETERESRVIHSRLLRHATWNNNDARRQRREQVGWNSLASMYLIKILLIKTILKVA